jgi:hypothetical protein
MYSTTAADMNRITESFAPTKLSQTTNRELYVVAVGVIDESEAEYSGAEAELELLDRVLQRHASRLLRLIFHQNMHPSILEFVSTLITSKDLATRREAAGNIPSFKLLQECYYAVTRALFSICETDIEKYTVCVLSPVLNEIFNGIRGWQP